MRHLKQNARAVAGVLLETHTAAVLQVDEHRKRVVDHLMRPLALQVRQRADAACVMFEFRPVQALASRRV